MTRVLIVGATSALAEATARLCAARGDALFLVARNADKLAPVATDLKVRGAASVDCHVLDAADVSAHEAMLDAAWAALGEIDEVLVAYGDLPDQARCETDAEAAVAAWQLNGVSTIALTTRLAQRLERQGHGLLAVISSVAGDRGRASNYVYGSAKAGVNVFLDGLRHRLAGTDIDILTVRPGLVDTPMTAHIDKSALFADPARVGRDIHRAMNRRAAVVYTPRGWRWIMTVVCALPRPLFHRTKF